MNLLDQVVSLTDILHLPIGFESTVHQHKEWHHFCILGNDVQVIVNFSLMGNPVELASDHLWQARLIMLVRDGVWDGDVDTIPSAHVKVQRGKLDMHFGQNLLKYRDGCFSLSLALEKRPITLKARIRPLAYPLIRYNTPIGKGKINWVVIPWLETSGTLAIGRRVYNLENTPTYHDHNWGSWDWGDNFSWQWGFALPEHDQAPWSVVFDHITDHARSRSSELRLSLWKGSQIHRLFMHEEIQIHQEGFFVQPYLSKFPRPMALVSPELTTDVPHFFEVNAKRHNEWMRVLFVAKDLAQIVVPNETNLGVTIINEVSGVLELGGSVQGESVIMRGRGFFEFLT